MKRLIILLLALASLSAPAMAQETMAIVQARRAGLIGERVDGYLGFVVTPSPRLRRQVGAINIRRRSLYSNLAARRGVTPEEVGVTAACTLLRRIAPGEYYLPAQGGWRRYAPGQASPAPSYCG
jgi:uncharacterized protein YdbL (DUF1318 family)